LFEENSVPGDEPDAETKLKALNLKAAISFNPGDFMVQAGYSYEQRNKNSVDDTEGRIGDYMKYRAEDKTIFATFNYRH
jgi:predicted porin